MPSPDPKHACLAPGDVARFVAATLPVADRAAAAAHAETCDACRQQIAAAVRAGRSVPTPSSDRVEAWLAAHRRRR